LLLTMLALLAASPPTGDALAPAVAEIVRRTQAGDVAGAQAASAALLRVAPDSLPARLADLRAHAADPDRTALTRAYEAWASTSPEDPVRRVALAVARLPAGPARWPSTPGAWCDDVLGSLNPLPTGLDDLATALTIRAEVEGACGRDDHVARTALAALAGATPFAPSASTMPSPVPSLHTALEEALGAVKVDVDGVRRPLSDIPGPVFVDVWATWCGPCKEALPAFATTAKAHPEVTFVVVSVDAREASADGWLHNAGLLGGALRTGWLGPSPDHALGLTVLPTSFLVDADHHLVTRHEGYDGPPSFEAMLKALPR